MSNQQTDDPFFNPNDPRSFMLPPAVAGLALFTFPSTDLLTALRPSVPNLADLSGVVASDLLTEEDLDAPLGLSDDIRRLLESVPEQSEL